MIPGTPGMAEITAVDPENPDQEIINKAATIIRSGGLVVFPTETVYGLGADATNASAVRRIFTAKGRPGTNPLIVHCESVDRIKNTCVSIFPPMAQKLASAFWPGPLTLILPKSSQIPVEVTAGLDQVGVRIPQNKIALALISAADRPLAAPSANKSNRLSPTKAEHVARDLGQEVDFILDAGPCSAGVESTVLDLTGANPIILRPGPIDAEALEEVLGKLVLSTQSFLGEEKAHVSPGQSRIHYAPSKPLQLWLNSIPASEIVNQKGIALLILGKAGVNHEYRQLLNLIPKPHFQLIEQPLLAERVLYALLHDWDQDNTVDQIHVVIQPNCRGSAWAAVRDRLLRAASTIS